VGNQATPAGRLTSVDALRGLAAFGVLISHVPHPWTMAGHFSGWLFLPVTFGKQGVTLFLVISGFCIHLGAAKALARAEGARCDWATFWRRRFRRLYPPYLAAILFTLLLGLMLLPHHPGLFAVYQSGQVSPAWDVLTHLFMVHNLSLSYVMGLGNGPFWTLGLEEQLYALYAVFLLLRSRLSAGRTLAVTVAVTLLWFAFGVAAQRAGHRQFCWYTWPFGYWLVWALGALAAEAHAGALALPRWCYRPRVGLALAGAGLLLQPPVPLMAYLDSGLVKLLGPAPWLQRLVEECFPLHLPSVYLVAVGSFVLLNAWLRAEARGVQAGRGVRRWARLGVMSYSLYLTHAPVLHVCEVGFMAVGITPTMLGTLLRYVVCVPLCLGVAWAFFRLVERHFLNQRPQADEASTGLRRQAA
jgi:peptidoglycan/LPS O-acetylase OafA/YrhL